MINPNTTISLPKKIVNTFQCC